MSESSLRLMRTGLAIALVVAAAMFGVWTGLGLPDSRFQTLFALVSQTLFASLCVVDSRIRKRSIVFMAQAALFFLWPIAVPIYLIWSRGWRGILVLAIWGTVLAGVMIAAGLVAEIVMA